MNSKDGDFEKAEEDYGVDDLLVSNDTLAFVVRSELELGASYTAQFVGCGVELEAEVEAASGGRRSARNEG